MPTPEPQQPAVEVTRLLASWRSGDRHAFDTLSTLVYQELRRIAANHLRNQPAGHTLQPTALVHEAYVKLQSWEGADLKDRSHFLAIAGKLMRQVLAEHARTKFAAKRGGGWQRLEMTDGMAVSADGSPEVVALDDALNSLAHTDERKSKIVEMRFFGGLTEAEIAEVLEISVTTVGREMRLALAWLYREMSGPHAG